jgi:hypothetical protein
MQLRRHSTLYPGDILLFRPRGKKAETLSDKFIAWGQRLFRQVPKNVNYVHVAIVDWNPEFILEARWPKSEISNLAIRRASSTDKIEVWRIKNLTPEQLKKILDYGHEHLGMWYDVLLFLTGFLSLKHTTICSLYVSRMCNAAGLDIPYGFKGKKLILPDDFVDFNTMLERVM